MRVIRRFGSLARRGHWAQHACPFRKLNPTVLIVKSAQDVASDDAAAALNGSVMWGIFLQAEMGPCRVVIRSVFLQDAPKMGLISVFNLTK
jgi:hypothetical protein